MFFPAEMTVEEIEQFEYEYNRLRDIELNEGQWWAVNAECQIVAQEQQEAHMVDLAVV